MIQGYTLTIFPITTQYIMHHQRNRQKNLAVSGAVDKDYDRYDKDNDDMPYDKDNDDMPDDNDNDQMPDKYANYYETAITEVKYDK